MALEMTGLLEAEGLVEADVWGINEMEEIEQILPMELSAQVPGMEDRECGWTDYGKSCGLPDRHRKKCGYRRAGRILPVR